MDIGGRVRGYVGKEGMRDTLSAHGGIESIAETVMRDYGCSEINPKTGQRGDVVLLETAQGDAMGAISMDGKYAITSGKRGWISLPIGSIKRAWRIG